MANYIPSPEGMFLANNSPAESHTVIKTYVQYYWLAILLVIVILIAIVWRYRTR
jgi:hypothetical protein